MLPNAWGAGGLIQPNMLIRTAGPFWVGLAADSISNQMACLVQTLNVAQGFVALGGCQKDNVLKYFHVDHACYLPFVSCLALHIWFEVASCLLI